jgi:2-oxoglutarate dehydrogenase E2 component (dihydrolipoamide succinyltransferase)
MIIEIKAPTPGESITEVQIANWLVGNGEYVTKNTELAEIDSDKATLTVNAESAGRVVILVSAGETVAIGTVIATVDTEAQAPEKLTVAPLVISPEAPAVAAPEKPAIPATAPAVADEGVRITPLARKMMEEKHLTGREILEQLGQSRITRQDVLNAASPKPEIPAQVPAQPVPGTRETERKKMSTLRLKLAERLVSVKNETAMLTTFNEVNMSQIMGLKKKHSDAFKEKYGIGIGFMSFFTKAVTIALNRFPQVNSMIDGDELLLHRYADIGIAVSAPKGLVVPVIRNAESLTLAEIELRIRELAGKARENRITLDEMSGGTFTITNGGVFGSMMSTPILNPPQSAILGMHNIIERPIAVNGQVVVAPMMYIALSYDHRVIDGRESVGFLVMVKELLENPSRMLFEGNDPVNVLLGI